MTRYAVNIDLTPGQQKRLGGYCRKCGSGMNPGKEIRFRIPGKNMQGKWTFMTSLKDFNRWKRNLKAGKGMELKFTPEEINEMMGAGLFDIFKKVAKAPKDIAKAVDRTLWDGFEVYDDLVDGVAKKIPGKYGIPIRLAHAPIGEIGNLNNKANKWAWEQVDNVVDE